MEKAGREYSQLKLQRDELSNERKSVRRRGGEGEGVMSVLAPPRPSRELWRRDAAVSQSIQATKDELHRWEKALRGTMTKVLWTCPDTPLALGVDLYSLPTPSISLPVSSPPPPPLFLLLLLFRPLGVVWSP